MAIEYFLCYHSYLDAIEPLNDAERGRLFTACLKYSMTGAVEHLGGNERFLFPALKSQIDRDLQKYETRCESQAAKARKRWDAQHATACHGINGNAEDATACTGIIGIAKNADDAKEKEKEKEKEKAKEKDIGKKTHARFTPPTLEEVQAYVLERGSPVEPQAFIDFYAAKGWMVGKTPMKDWKAACRNAEKWERWANRPVGSFPARSPSGNVFADLVFEGAFVDE
jgi:hypothetical protein